MTESSARILMAKAVHLADAGYPDEAGALLDEIASQLPYLPDVHYHAGNVKLQQGDFHSARFSFERLVALSPDFMEGVMLLGMVMAEVGAHEAALPLLTRVLDHFPTLLEVRYRLGLSSLALKQHENALRIFQEILAIDPEHVGALNGIGLVMTELARIEEARHYFSRALSIDPGAVDVLNNMGRVHRCGHPEESLSWFEKGLEIDPTNRSLVSNYLYGLNYVPDISREFIALQYRRRAPLAYAPSIPNPSTPERPRSGKSRIRIGFVSADFYAHSVSFFLEPYFVHYDRDRFELVCYSNGTKEDGTTVRLRSMATHWRSIVGMDDRCVASLIDDDRIDILVDLSGHTAGNRMGVFMLRPAPVQVSWLGHPNTTGLPAMDYYVTDSWCDPPGTVDHLFTEKLYRLPRIFCTYLPPDEFPPVAPSPSISRGEVTFGSFNNLAKINPMIISLWGQILRKVPGSRMILKDPKFEDQAVRREVGVLFKDAGIELDRIEFRGLVPTRYDHLRCYDDIDIALDTFPYHGTTTTCEALWMGVPVVTRAGDTHVSRVGVSLLRSVGLSGFISHTDDEYVNTSVMLACDEERRLYLRKGFRLMMARSPLMDYAGVARELEEAFMAMLTSCPEKRRS